MGPVSQEAHFFEFCSTVNPGSFDVVDPVALTAFRLDILILLHAQLLLSIVEHVFCSTIAGNSFIVRGNLRVMPHSNKGLDSGSHHNLLLALCNGYAKLHTVDFQSIMESLILLSQR